MRTTKLFKSGNSMAVRIPKDFKIIGNEVEILKKNNSIIIREIPQNLSKAFFLIQKLPSDFFKENRVDLPPQGRDKIF